jgi:hypothetical protein
MITQLFHRAKGTFLRIPAGVTHDFEDRSVNWRGFSILTFQAVSKKTCLRSLSGLKNMQWSDSHYTQPAAQPNAPNSAACRLARRSCSADVAWSRR